MGAQRIYWIVAAVAIAVISLGAIILWASRKPEACPVGQVCLSQGEFSALTNTRQGHAETSIEKDRRVLDDPLHPPINRMDAASQDALDARIRNRDMYVPTTDVGDSFRLVGYLVSSDEAEDRGGNSWKLFAREKDRHTSEFYMVPANRNYDIKVPIKDEIVSSGRLRDLYNIPDEISFKSPFLNSTPYKFIQLEKAQY